MKITRGQFEEIIQNEIERSSKKQILLHQSGYYDLSEQERGKVIGLYVCLEIIQEPKRFLDRLG